MDKIIEIYKQKIKEGINPNFPLNHIEIELYATPIRPLSHNFKYHLIIRFPYGSDVTKKRDYISVMEHSLEDAISKMIEHLESYFSTTPHRHPGRTLIEP